MPFSDPLTLFIMACAFVLVLAIWGILLLLLARRHAARQEKVQQRLDYLAQPEPGQGRVLRLWRDGEEATTTVPENARSLSLAARLEAMRQAANMQTPLSSLILFTCGAAIAAAVITLLVTGHAIVAPIAAGTVFLIAWTVLTQRVARQQQIFDRQFVDALELAARSLRAGHPLTGAFRLIAEEIPAPVGQVFAEIYQQQNLGIPLDTALRQAAGAGRNTDLKLFATSVIIQLRSGGNLADMMDRLAFVIRDRIRLSRRIRVLTSQTQFSKRVLLALPFLIFVALNLLNPRYMAPLFQTGAGNLILFIAGAMLIIGAWAMNRLAIIRY